MIKTNIKINKLFKKNKNIIVSIIFKSKMKKNLLKKSKLNSLFLKKKYKKYEIILIIFQLYLKL